MDDEVPLDPATFPLVAYVHYRPAGGLIMSIVNHGEGIADDARREFLLVLDRHGWRDVSLNVPPIGSPFPGFPGYMMGARLPVHGYMRHPQAYELPDNNAGWTRTAHVPQLGRTIPLPDRSPAWKLPVVRLGDGGRADFCSCDRESVPPRSYCRFCPPGRQETVYLYAVQAPPGGSGISALRSRH